MKNQYKKRLRTKWIATVLAFATALMLPLGASASIAADDAVNPPEVTVSAVATDSGGYVEIGLNVRSGAADFQSVGAILSYNPAYISPVKWDKDPDTKKEPVVPITPIDGSLPNPGYWHSAVALEAKGSGMVSGKVAMTYQETLNSKTSGYLYLSAELAKQEPLNQMLPAEATPTMTEGENPVRQTTTNGLPLYGAAKAAKAVQQSVVVRFQVNKDADEKLYTLDQVFGSIDLVKDTSAGTGIDLPALKTSPVYDKSGIVYYASNNTLETLGADVPVKATMLRVTDGKTANTGTASAEDFGTIVFYDWDKTLLGVVTVNRSASDEEIQAAMDAFADSKKASKETDYATVSNPDDGYYSKVVDGVDIGAKYPLTYKKAYRFEGVWLDANSDAFECYREKEDSYYVSTRKPDNHGIRSDYKNAGLASFEQIKLEVQENGYIAVKAAYKAEKNVNTGTGFFRYTISDNIEYNRYGGASANGGSYSIKFKISRDSAARIHQPTIKVTLTPEAAAIQSLLTINLENKDIMNVEVVAHKLVVTVRAALIDMLYSPSWASSATEYTSAKTFTNRVSKTRGTDGFVKYGTIGYINSQCVKFNTSDPTNEWDANVNFNAFQDAGLTFNGTTISTAEMATESRRKIEKAMKSNNNVQLSFNQIQYAINNQGQLLTE